MSLAQIDERNKRIAEINDCESARMAAYQAGTQASWVCTCGAAKRG